MTSVEASSNDTLLALNPITTLYTAAYYKFIMTDQSLKQYQKTNELMLAQSNCEKQRCLKLAEGMQSDADVEELQACVKNCSTGFREVLKMQNKHAEISRITYA